MTLPGCTLYFYHTLPSAPLPKLVYFHGGRGNGPQHIPLFSPLYTEFQVFLPSARGFGKSVSAKPGPTSTLEMVDDATAFIQHISPEDKVFVIGHAMGATVASRVAKFHPELVKGLILEDPAWFAEEGQLLPDPTPELTFTGPPSGPRPSYPFQQEHAKGGVANMGGGAWASPMGDGDNGSKLSERTPSGVGGKGGSGRRSGLWKGRGKGDVLYYQAVSSIEVPTLVFSGGLYSHCQRSVLEACLKTYAEGSREYNFPTAGHDIHSWFPEEWRAQVVIFFLRLSLTPVKNRDLASGNGKWEDDWNIKRELPF
eukprot:TRINITY_DN8850_c0_g1_i1.p1 TRINITY_DN8850_c0_g1~~TRINITY_DN8850_c0_g1_i1.p1  ORF type:complete len:312 (-),score=44.02 TRINITY_DN8850_c0_g1_i1:404-1339(-)